jgi:negative regulator of replication initiation
MSGAMVKNLHEEVKKYPDHYQKNEYSKEKNRVKRFARIASRFFKTIKPLREAIS